MMLRAPRQEMNLKKGDKELLAGTPLPGKSLYPRKLSFYAGELNKRSHKKTNPLSCQSNDLFCPGGILFSGARCRKSPAHLPEHPEFCRRMKRFSQFQR